MLMLLPSGFSVSDQTSVWWLEALVNWRGEVSAAEDQLESVCGSQRSGFKHNDALIVSSLKGLWHQLKQIPSLQEAIVFSVPNNLRSE